MTDGHAHRGQIRIGSGKSDRREDTSDGNCRRPGDLGAERQWVRRVYGLPGDSLNGFTDAIRRSEAITDELLDLVTNNVARRILD